jgi:hypothetical protein
MGDLLAQGTVEVRRSGIVCGQEGRRRRRRRRAKKA